MTSTGGSWRTGLQRGRAGCSARSCSASGPCSHSPSLISPIYTATGYLSPSSYPESIRLFWEEGLFWAILWPASIGILFSVLVEYGPTPPRRLTLNLAALLHARESGRAAVVGLAVGAALGLVLGFGDLLEGAGEPPILYLVQSSFVLGAGLSFAFWLGSALSEPTRPAGALDPTSSWRGSLAYGLVLGMCAAMFFWLVLTVMIVAVFGDTE